MITLCPTWFHGKDIVIDMISALVLFMIAYTSLRFYHLDKRNNKYFYFSISFLLIGLSFLAKILSNFNIYYDFVKDNFVGVVVVTMSVVKTTNVLYYFGFLFYRALTLFGLYFLYSLYQKHQSRGTVVLFSFFILVISYISQDIYFLFHVTALLFLFFLSRHYFFKYFENGNLNTFLVGLSFFVICLSQALFSLMAFDRLFYVLAEVVQLFGYGLLLVTFVKVLKNGKKKKQN